MTLPSTAEIVSYYLYGTRQPPSEKASEALIRESGLQVPFPITINMSEFMDPFTGPGRFATPAGIGASRGERTIIDRFFAGEVDLPEGAYSLQELLNRSGGGNPVVYSLQGLYFQDGYDDFAYRAFVWQNMGFRISDNALFIVDHDGNRSIANFAMVPATIPGTSINFDFASDSFASRVFNYLFEGLFDPSQIGRTVTFNFVNDLVGRTYTAGDYIADQLLLGSWSNPIVPNFAEGYRLTHELADELWNAGIINPVQDGRYVVYGTDDDDNVDALSILSKSDYDRQKALIEKGGYLFGGDGDDTLWAAGGKSDLDGGKGDDTLFGTRNDDKLTGGEGADELNGGGGDDILYADADDSTISGGAGEDTVDYSDSDVPINWQAARAVVSGVEKVIGSEYDDVLALTLSVLGLFEEKTEIDGNGGDDQIVGSSADNKLSGGEGDDKIEGKEGDDELIGGVGDDEIKGNDDDDRLDGGEGDDKLEGNEGEDVLRAGAGNDFLSGGDDKDEMFGGDGDDLMTGDAGEDRMFGDAGADRILGGEGEDYVHAGEGDDLVGGGEDKDEIYGDEGNDRILGEGGEDRLFGGVGDDLLSGGEGQDILNGESGNDILDAAQDDSSIDILKGEGGSDTFLVNNGDQILDLGGGDRIKLGGRWLNGGEKKLPPEDPCNPGSSPDEVDDGIYKGSDGTRYTLSGSTLTVSSGGQQIVLENFRNNDGGIRLRPERTRQDQAECRRDPLIIDFDGDRDVYDKLADSNAYFDLDNDGFAEHVAWARKDDGFLVLDRNRNGRIDDGTELFGSNYTQRTGGQQQQVGEDGFNDLAKLDSNGDYLITAADLDFAKLQVWIDANGDGVTQDGELKSLAELGIVSISLSARTSDAEVCGCDGTIVPLMSDVLRADGSSLLIYDAFLALDQYDTRELNPAEVPEALRDLPFLIGSGTLSDLDVAMARDPGLEQLVREFAALDLSRVAEIPVRIDEIILRWTGAYSVAADSRGPVINAQWLAALEKMSGSDFYQAVVGSNPRADAASMLVEDWQAVTRRVTAELLGQTSLGELLMPGLRFAGGAFFQVDEGTSLASVLGNLVANRPTGGPGDQARYWHTMTATLVEYHAGFGTTEAQILAAIDALPEVRSLGLTASELVKLSVAGAANDVVIGTGAAAGTSGADVLLSDVGGATLSGTSGDDVYILSSAASGTKIVDRTGHERLVLLGQSRESITVTVQLTDGSNFDGDLPIGLRIILTNQSTGWTIELAGRLRNGAIELDIEIVDFADQKGLSLVDLLPNEVVSEDGRKIYFGVDDDGSLPGGTGDDIIVGGANGDSYRLDATSGQDRIEDRGSSGVASTDRLFISSDRGSVTFEIAGAVGESLVVRNADGQSVTILRQWNEPNGIEIFEFSDGTSMTAQEVKALLLTGTTGADRIEGTSAADVIDGRGGGDVLKGNFGNDVYVFERGYGLLTVVDPLGLNRIRFGADIGQEDISLERRPDGMLISIIGTSDAVLVQGGRSYQDLMLDFAEGSISVTDLILSLASPEQLPEDGVIRGTSKTDFSVEGTPGNDVIDGLGGDEWLEGDEGDDTYIYSSGRKSIFEDGGFDVIRLAPDLTYDKIILLNGMITFEGSNGYKNYIEVDNRINSDGTATVDTRGDFVEGLIFADGRTLNIAGGKILAGGDGDDILFSFGSTFDVFTPGKGNDRIFASEGDWGTANGTKTVILARDFGHDVFYPGTNFRLDLTAFTLDSSVVMRREDNDLIVSTDNGANDIRVMRVFDPVWIAKTYAQSSLLFANGVSLSMAGIVNRMTVATSGDDVLFGRTSLDGGAGNDILIGDSVANAYRFGKGYGHDVIKEHANGNTEYNVSDTLTLVGLKRADVSFSRDPADPQTIVITILETGETLRLDGTPFDDLTYLHPEDNYNPNGFDDTGGHYIERIVFSDGTEVSQKQIEKELLDAEATSGDDVIYSFGTPRRAGVEGSYMNGGAGNDIYHIDFINAFIQWSAGSGTDRLVQTAGFYREAYIKLSGIQAKDILVSIELIDGEEHTILRARDGSELIIPGPVGFGRRVIVTAEDGVVHEVRQAGPLMANALATAGDDWLRGQTTGPWTSFDRPTPSNEFFDPGAGNDVVAGYGGNDTIRFGRGDGKDVLLDSVNMGPNEDKPQTYTIAFKAGIAREDVKVEWAPDGSGNLKISIIGTEDSILVSPHNFVAMTFVGGHVVRTANIGDGAEILNIKALFPVATAGDDILFVDAGKTIDGGAGNDTIYYVQGLDRPNGGSTIVFGRGLGNDVFSNAAGVALYDSYFWHNDTRHTVFLKGIQSIEEIRLIKSGADLIIEIRDTGERLTIKNQILRELSNDYAETPVQSIRLESGDFYYYPWLQDLIVDDDYAGDDEIESGPTGGILDGGAGNDLLKGSLGDDSYILGRGYDEDVIVDAGGSADRILFEEGVGAAVVVFSRVGANGNDLLIEVLGQDRLTMTVSNQFGSAASRIESFVFADGEVLSWAEVQQAILDDQATSAADVIAGFATADRIAGGSGGDQLTGLGGNDRIDGGAGRDSAIFRGKSSEYRITTVDGVTTVEDLVAGRDGVDQLVNVEDLRFLGDEIVTPLVAANRAPVALPGSAATTEDGEIVIARADIMALATDADGDALTLAVGAASNGRAWIDRDGNVHFRPTADHSGVASFDYTVSDGNGGVSTATYAVNVVPLNDAPRATTAHLGDVVAQEDGSVAIALPAGLFEDPDGPSITLSLAGGDGGPAPAWLTLANGIITGTPPANFNGQLELTVVGSDGEFSGSVAISLTILPSNDAPAYVAGVEGDEARPGVPFELNFGPQPFQDVDGDAVVVSVTSADGSPLPAWLSYSGGVLRGTPPSDFEGLELLLTGSDGRSSTKAYVSLQTPLNSAPQLVNPVADLNSGEDQPVDLLVPADVFSDADGDTLSLTLVQADGSPLPSWLSFADGRLTGTPPENHHGVLDLILVASDGSLSASDSFRLTIQSVNDAPQLIVPMADFGSDEDQAIDLALPDGAFRDVDGDALSFTLTQADGSPLPAWLSFADGRLTGTPPQDHHGALDLVLTASDGFLSASDNFQLTIRPVNDAPELVNPMAARSSIEDHPIDLIVPANVFRDADGDTLSLTLTQAEGAALPSWLGFADGRLTGTPPANFHGALDLVLTASDGLMSATDSFRLTIESVNDAPVVSLALIDRTVSAADVVDFTIPAETFQDADGDSLQLSARLASGDALPSWLTFTAGRFLGQAPAGYSGELLIDVSASDGTASANDRFSLTLRKANEAPTANDDQQFFTVQGYDLVILPEDALANDTDPNGDLLSITALGSASHGTVSFDSDGKIRYSPDGSFAGSDQFTYTITDGEFVSTALISVRVESAFSNWGQGTEWDDRLFGNHILVNRLFGAGGNDHIKGGNLEDWLAGGEGADHIQGLSGNDHLWGGAGNDKLLGGGGFDTAYFMGSRASYSIVTLNGELSVVDNAPTVDGNDGRDVIGSIELLSFKNGETLSVVSPIILDLEGNGVQTVSASRSRARFDMNGDGQGDDTSWIGRRDAFLFLDRDGNGTVTNIGEMSFTDDLPGAASDLHGLRAFDSNKDGLLSAADARFSEFKVWRDANGDGVVAAHEILGLDEIGFKSMNLTGVAHDSTVAPGDVAIINTGSWTRTDGKTLDFADAAMTFYSGGQSNSPSDIRHALDVIGDLMRGGDRAQAELGLITGRAHKFRRPDDLEELIRHQLARDDSTGPAIHLDGDGGLAPMIQDIASFSALQSMPMDLQRWEDIRPIDIFTG